MDICKVPIVFLGINYYSRAVIRSDAVKEEDNDPVLRVQDGPRTDMNWEVHPESLEKLLVRLKDEYAPERIIITENGAAYPTGVSDDGKVHDQERLDYFRGHLVSCAKAIERGVPLTGYYAWSLMDNFEWAFGYEKRFGWCMLTTTRLYERRRKVRNITRMSSLKMGSLMKNRFAFLVMFFCASAAHSAPASESTRLQPADVNLTHLQVKPVTVVANENGAHLEVDGTPFLVRGMNWGYMPIGQNYSYDLWSKDEAFITTVLHREMGQLKTLGVNAIRLFSDVPPKWVEWMYDKYGIRVALNHLMGRYGFNVEGVWVSNIDYANPTHRKAILDDLEKNIKRYAGTRGVLMATKTTTITLTSFEIEPCPARKIRSGQGRYILSWKRRQHSSSGMTNCIPYR